MEPSHVPLRPGERVEIADLLRSIIIGSDNDSAMALARATAGSSDLFVQEMNAEALKLGMTRTRFGNPHGLPGTGQVTTVRDLMALSTRSWQNRSFGGWPRPPLIICVPPLDFSG